MHSLYRTIRKTVVGDLGAAMAIYEQARQRMRDAGNHEQWVNGYPSEDVIRYDIANGNSYVIVKYPGPTIENSGDLTIENSGGLAVEKSSNLAVENRGDSTIEKSGDLAIENRGEIVGIFTFIVGDEPTYDVIEGEWPDDLPYGTIHRIAGVVGCKGIADAALDFCRSFNVNIRIDTHRDNTPMLGWINSRGFTYCGIIYVSDGTPRLAFQRNRC